MKRYLYFICLMFLLLKLNAEDQTPKKKTICLNMIVKNETKVITRCLSSVKPIIDYWVIVDTGSTDGTQKMIKEFMKDIPGELHERPWVNFGHNRNEALKLAKDKADYILFIDADEVLETANNFKIPDLNKDFYHIMTLFSGTTYARAQLIKNSLNWQWKGVLHETVDSPEARTSGILAGINNIVYTDGARSQDPQKYQKDAKILEAALKDEPNNSRYVFYLAQSYKDAGEYENAIKYYEKRIEMGGWAEEIFWSMLQIAQMEQALNKPSDVISKAYYRAFNYRPTRAEPLYSLANYHRLKGEYATGYLLASIANKIPMPKDLLFVNKWIYDIGNPLELSICAYWIGKFDECQQISLKLTQMTGIAENVKECAQNNLNFATKKLVEIFVNQKMAEANP